MTRRDARRAPEVRITLDPLQDRRPNPHGDCGQNCGQTQEGRRCRRLLNPLESKVGTAGFEPATP